MRKITLQGTHQLAFLAACNLNLTGRLNYGGKAFEIAMEDGGQFRVGITPDADDSDGRDGAGEVLQALERGANHWRSGAVPGDLASMSSLDDAACNGCDFSGLSLAHRQFKHVRFIECRFSGADIRHSTFIQCTFEQCQFSGEGSPACFDESSFQECGFYGVNAQSVFFTGTRFIGCDLTRVKAGGAQFVSATFTNCNLTDVELNNANLLQARFSDCPAGEVDFTGATINDAVFLRFGGTGEPGDEPRLSFRETVARQTRFYECRLSNANFQDANLLGAEMFETTLNGAILCPGTDYHLRVDKKTHSTLPPGSSARIIPSRDPGRYREKSRPSSLPVQCVRAHERPDTGPFVTGRSWTDVLYEFTDFLSCAQAARSGDSPPMGTSGSGSDPASVFFPSDRAAGFFSERVYLDSVRPSTPGCSFPSSDSSSPEIPSISFHTASDTRIGSMRMRGELVLQTPTPAAVPQSRQLHVPHDADSSCDESFAEALKPATREEFDEIIRSASPDTPLVLELDGRLWDVSDNDVFRLQTQAQLEDARKGKLDESAALSEEDRQAAFLQRRHLARIRLIHCSALTDAGHQHIAKHAEADLRLVWIERSPPLNEMDRGGTTCLKDSLCIVRFLANDQPVRAAGALDSRAHPGLHPETPPLPVVTSVSVAPGAGQYAAPLPVQPQLAQPSAGDAPRSGRADASHQETSSLNGTLALYTFSPLTRWAMVSFLASTPHPAIRLVLDARRWAVNDQDLAALGNYACVHAIHLINNTSLTGAALKGLAHLPNLRALSIEGGSVTGTMLEGLMEQFAIQAVDPQTASSAAGSLKHLSLSACPFTERLGARIACLPGLESLELRGMTAVSPIDLSFLAGMSLTSLVLTGTRCDARTLEAVNSMESLAHWESGIMSDRSDE